jgi:predicted ATPase/class 3 adenylate cyclase
MEGVGVAELPSGTVTFLFTDLEGSTRMWEEHPDAMRPALARHDELLTAAVLSTGGAVVKTTGDGVHAVFATADAAVVAALVGQHAIAAEPWSVSPPLSVRMGLHTGSAELRDGDYYGSVLNRAARLMSAAHGGQVVVSHLTADLVRETLPPDVELVDLGEHRLRDLAAPMRVFQVQHSALTAEFPPLASVDAASGNLPLQLSSFVGRERELARVRELIGQRRLLTLTGVGGVGKTRLALQAAVDALPVFPGGAWLVELARTGDPSAVVAVVARALGAAAQPGRADIDVVCDHLGATRSILVLDNCEHVLDAAADLTEAVLDRCPQVVVLATSREALDLDGEQVVPVRPLDPATDAMSLFAERARDVDPEFALTPESTPAVREICLRLDGVPLAIELAAVRVDVMTPSDIAARLDDRFRLLASGRRRSVDRHQTLRSTLEWSYQLLGEPERVLLRRLGVFAGGFSSAAAREVCAVDNQERIEDELASLVRKSLVQFERDPYPGRHRLLETVRVFALEQLAAAGESDTIGRAHAEWVAGLVDRSIEDWETADAVVLATVRRELDNWREAVNFAVSTDDPELALRLTVHTMGASIPETARWSEAARTMAGMERVPGANWLDLVRATRGAAEMDLDLLKRAIRAFEDATTDERDRAWIAPYVASRDHDEDRDPVVALDAALAIPGLSPVLTADLLMYRAFYRNLTPPPDEEAARVAVRACTDARTIALPMAHVALALALHHDDPERAMDAVRCAEDLAERSGDSFLIASAATWGSIVVLELPADIAAPHLIERLDKLQSHYSNAAPALLAVCATVLERTGDPDGDRVAAFVLAAPGASGARAAAPDLHDPGPLTDAPASFDDAVALARSALARITPA